MVRPPKAVQGDNKIRKKGAWSEEEDTKLRTVLEKGCAAEGLSWETISEKAGLDRCGKSCRLRWKNYLSPHLLKGDFSQQEEETINRLQSRLGNKWSQIAAKLPGRTHNDVKNLWNTKLRKRLQQQAILQNSSNLQTSITHHYNFLANNFQNLLFHAILNMPIANNLLLNEWMTTSHNQDYSWPQLQSIDSILPLPKPACYASDAWFQAGLRENSFFDSNFVGICNESDTAEYSKLPELTNDEIPVDSFINEAVNEMNYEFHDPSSAMRVSPLFMEDASTSNFYDGASCFF